MFDRKVKPLAQPLNRLNRLNRSLRFKTNEEDRIKPFLQQNGGYFGGNDSEPRKAKRVKAYPFELKVRGLEAEFVVDCLNEGLIGS